MKFSLKTVRIGLTRAFTVAGLVAITFFVMSPAQAALMGTVAITTGGVFPGNVTGTTAGTLLAATTDPYTFTTTSGTTSGTLYSAVYRESSGTLDFYYQIAASPTAATGIAREIDTNFSGYMVYGGYRTDNTALTGSPFITPNPSGTSALAPMTADYNASTGVVGFTFNPPDSNKVYSNQVSSILVISTNATNYTTGNSAVIDGGTQTVTTFQPAASTVPEPASLAFIGLGLVGFAGIKRFRKA